MNRLSPLIVRRTGRFAPSIVHYYQAPATAFDHAAEPFLSDDTKLFLTGWLGGLVFFGTFLS